MFFRLYQCAKAKGIKPRISKTKYERIKEENEDLQLEVHVKKRSIKDAKANQAKFKNELQELQK